ncbi:hypothetical protein NIES21_53430 [Anabaenopsis circularis NIES-21]|uniref:eCIS core domain-containing protein n=1 Tax=Anabaenopsis circularis NIES-21 TaxID=1085406 RepID=A0A1Z4GPR1_9CYAN|nr:hypothetical protein NIES21_53430 [Anabaenopsis circularis NIES-21]
MYTRQYKTKKASTNSSDTTTSNQFAPRRFVVQPQAEEITNNQTPDIQTQLAKQSGNSLRDISVFPSHFTQPQLQPIQMKLTRDLPLQVKGDLTGNSPDSSVEQRPNKTGMPDALKAGVESLSGYSLDDVRVHYNSPKPTQLQALAYTQGTEIYVASGQEEHLPHEAWHVIQQMQGRVKPTMQKKGVEINDEQGLEKEADIMGVKASSIPVIQEKKVLKQKEPNKIAQFGKKKTKEAATKRNANKKQKAQSLGDRSYNNLVAYRSGWVKKNGITAEDVKEFRKSYKHGIRGHSSGDNNQGEQGNTTEDCLAYKSWHTREKGQWL